jgi:hypothetical protein
MVEDRRNTREDEGRGGGKVAARKIATGEKLEGREGWRIREEESPGRGSKETRGRGLGAAPCK